MGKDEGEDSWGAAHAGGEGVSARKMPKESDQAPS